MVLSVSERTFTQEVLESNVPVLVNFWAPWCGLCRIIQPLLLDFQKGSGGQVKLVSINADENFKLANTYRLTNLPTLLLIDDGEVRHRLESFHRRDEIRLALEAIGVGSQDRGRAYAGVGGTASAADWECRSA